jgi:hypothetical protein
VIIAMVPECILACHGDAKRPRGASRRPGVGWQPVDTVIRRWMRRLRTVKNLRFFTVGFREKRPWRVFSQPVRERDDMRQETSRRRRRLAAILGLAVLTAGTAVAAVTDDIPPNPFPRALVVGPAVARWEFDGDVDGWQARHHCALAARDGLLVIDADGFDPYLSAPVAGIEVPLVVQLRLRSHAGGTGQLFWTTDRHRGESPDRVVSFDIPGDGRWHEPIVPLPVEGAVASLRLDPVAGTGRTEVDWITLHTGGPHPLEIVALDAEPDRDRPGKAVVQIHNHAAAPLSATLAGVARTLPPGASRVVVDVPGKAPLSFHTLRLESAGLPTVERSFWIYRPGAPVDGIRRPLGDGQLVIARDGSHVRFERNGDLAAALAPLAHVGGRLPTLAAIDPAAWPLVLEGDGLRVTLGTDVAGGLTTVIEPTSALDDTVAIEGPVVRAFGRLEQGLLCGVEYLGRDERSSSTLDIETDEHLRFAPDPLDVTLPLMAFVTDRATVALAWDDAALQPTFATPDFVDLAAGHRMSLRGGSIGATVRLDPGWDDGGRLEEAILWAVQRRGGLPPPPSPPRPVDAQMALALAAYDGLIRDPDTGGWFHAVVPGIRRMPEHGAPLADCVSAIFRLTGRVPEVDRLQPGGAHVVDPTSFFVTGRAAQWRRHVDAQAAGLRAAQQADGSWRYDGPYARGHFETTASGVCARPCAMLLEHAWLTGNADSLAAGLRGLDFLGRFRTPRGAQVWEVPLHTPDLLASAYATWAHVRAFELTGDEAHRVAARRWALTGLPFVYQWSHRPIMAYATIAVYGATNWRAPNWIGLPVQWCGTVYAHALLRLAAHDATLDWRRLAEGMTVCAEQMLYPDGPSIGCLPDVFDLRVQRRLPADINPGVVVSLRRQLEGLPDGLSVAVAEGRRVVAPFPVSIQAGTARVEAARGLRYQVLVDDGRVVDVESRGDDVIPLAAP